jgi:hypothetical protein
MTDERSKNSGDQMKSEGSFDVEETPPLRVSGFICLGLGVLSGLSIIAKSMLILPIAAFLFGLFALRKSHGPRPVGTRVACIGMFLAVAFGSCGYMVDRMKTETLSRQAENFARNYMELIVLGQDEHAMELQKEWFNRLSTDMNLAEHYTSDPRIVEQLVQFKTDAVNRELKRRGAGAEWVVDRPTSIYYQFGSDHAEIIWSDPTLETPMKIQMFMDYRIDKSGLGQWQMKRVLPLRRRFVAERVL